MLAALPMLAFAGADYLFAPPAGNARSDINSSDVSTSDRVDQKKGVGAATSGVRHAAGPTATGDEFGAARRGGDRAQTADRGEDRHSSLVASIQGELSRVGCYSGDADGAWNDRTKVAMRAFNDSVHVNLATDQPDFVLLTLLRGHSGKACSRACNGIVNAGAQCIDRTIEARRVPPATLPPRQAAVDRGGKATISSATVAAPIAPTWSTTSTRVPATALRLPRHDPTPQFETTAATAEAVSAARKPEPFSGRMAVGVVPTDTPKERDSLAVVPEVEPVPDRAPRLTYVRPTPAARPSVSGSSGRSRLSRTFIELGRNSP
jgi:hypothetical protein